MTELLIFGLECQIMENVKDLENMSVIASFHKASGFCNQKSNIQERILESTLL